MDKKNTRLEWIDNAKGIGILLVVLGHTYGIPYQLHHIIYTFHMPLFFLLSGYTFRQESAKECPGYIRKQARAYLVPYFVLALLNFCGNMVYELYCHRFSWGQQLRYLAGTLYCYANMEWMPMCSPIWFLCSIFIVKTLYGGLLSGKSRRCRYAAAILCAAISYGSSLLNVPRLPWNLLPSLFGLFFFHIGVEMGHYQIIDRLRRCKVWYLIGIPAAILCLPLAAENLVGMNENTYGSLWIFLPLSLLYSCLLMSLCSNRRNILTWFGQNTVIFMGFNYLMRAYTVEVYYLIPVIRNYPIRWPVYFAIILLSLTVIAYGCQKFCKR